MRIKKDDNTTFYPFLKPFLGLLSLLIIGTVGYIKIEGWNFLDSLFMSVETLTTVGYGFVHPLSHEGKIFTLIYIIFGVILFLYIASEFAHHIILTNFEKVLKRKNMETRLRRINDHYIICGFGRTGAEIAIQLKNSKLDFVIVDKSPEIEDLAQSFGYNYVIGDATDDETLEKAGIAKAKGLFCALCDDVDNLYLTLSSRNLNSEMNIVSRCVKASNESKFRKAGATNVILPYEISGRRMVTSIVKPLVVDFLDVVMHTKGQELELKMEQFKLEEGSLIENQTILSSELKQKTGIIVIAIKRENEYITNPAPDTLLKAGDYLITLGTSSQLTKFEELGVKK